MCDLVVFSTLLSVFYKKYDFQTLNAFSRKHVFSTSKSISSYSFEDIVIKLGTQILNQIPHIGCAFFQNIPIHFKDTDFQSKKLRNFSNFQLWTKISQKRFWKSKKKAHPMCGILSRLCTANLKQIRWKLWEEIDFE